jgi:hypothetical protein
MEELTGVVRSAEAKQRQRNRAVRAMSCGGGRWLMAREDGRDMGSHWGGVDGAHRWPVAARQWSAMARHVSTIEEWGR